MEAFSDLRMSHFLLDSHKIRNRIGELCRTELDTLSADYQTKSYYNHGGAFLWIERIGVDDRADSLLAVLRTVDGMGFTQRSFEVDDIGRDLVRMRTLDFDDDENSINNVMARLEFRLTKSYLRYVIGQRFGFVNPYYVYNRLDLLNGDDSLRRSNVYRRLFDIEIERPDERFIAAALRKVCNDSVSAFLREIQPDSKLYYRLKKELGNAEGSYDRMRILCNMERCRWRKSAMPDTTGKYIVVNIPAFTLYAKGGEDNMDMRIGCGALKTKTPLLISAINRMDVNPVWNIPYSIISKEVAPHAGDIAYFERNRYYVVEKETGARVDIEDLTAAMLKSGRYAVIQEGGEGNSLGRIIFRFPNNFSVFLHDTSSTGVFNRENRSVSHGCVRVQRPFDLAMFLLGDTDEWLMDKLRISMGLTPTTERGIRFMRSNPEAPRLVSSLKVKPDVPVFILYYTIFPDNDDRLTAFPDVYGYDRVMSNHIKPFIK